MQLINTALISVLLSVVAGQSVATASIPSITAPAIPSYTFTPQQSAELQSLGSLFTLAGTTNTALRSSVISRIAHITAGYAGTASVASANPTASAQMTSAGTSMASSSSNAAPTVAKVGGLLGAAGIAVAALL